MDQGLRGRIQNLGSPWAADSESDQQLVTEVARLVREAPQDIVAGLPLLELLHKLLLSAWLLDARAVPEGEARDFPVLLATESLLQAICNSAAAAQAISYRALSRLLDEQLPSPQMAVAFLQECRDRHQQYCPQASLFAKTIGLLHSDLLPRLRAANVGDALSETLHSLGYLLQPHIADRVSKTLCAPSMTEFEASLEQLLFDLDTAAAQVHGYGRSGLCAMALVAAQNEAGWLHESLSLDTGVSGPRLAQNAAELVEVLLPMALDDRHSAASAPGVGIAASLRLAAVLMPQVLSRAATSVSSASPLPATAPWSPEEHLALWAIETLIQSEAQTTVSQSAGSLQGQVQPVMEIICCRVLMEAAQRPYRAVLEQAMLMVGRFLWTLCCRWEDCHGDAEQKQATATFGSDRTDRLALVGHCLESDLRYWPALASWLEPTYASHYFMSFAMEQIKRSQSLARTSQNLQQEHMQKELLSLLLRHQMELERSAVCCTSNDTANKGKMSYSLRMAPGQDTILQLCQSQKSARMLFPAGNQGLLNAPASSAPGQFISDSEVYKQRALCLGVLMKAWEQELKFIAGMEGSVDSSETGVSVQSWLERLKVVVDYIPSLYDPDNKDNTSHAPRHSHNTYDGGLKNIEYFLHSQHTKLRMAMARAADSIYWGTQVRQPPIIVGDMRAEKAEADAAALREAEESDRLAFGDVAHTIVQNLHLWSAVLSPDLQTGPSNTAQSEQSAAVFVTGDTLPSAASALIGDGGLLFTLPLLGVALADTHAKQNQADPVETTTGDPSQMRMQYVPAFVRALTEVWEVVKLAIGGHLATNAPLDGADIGSFRNDAFNGWLATVACILNPLIVDKAEGRQELLDSINACLDQLGKESGVIREPYTERIMDATRAVVRGLLRSFPTSIPQGVKGTLLATPLEQRGGASELGPSVSRILTHADLFRSGTLETAGLRDQRGFVGPGSFYTCKHDLESAWTDKSADALVDYIISAIGVSSISNSPLAGYLVPSWESFNRALVVMTGLRPSEAASVCNSVAKKVENCRSILTFDVESAEAFSGRSIFRFRQRCAFAKLAMAAALSRSRSALQAFRQLVLLPRPCMLALSSRSDPGPGSMDAESQWVAEALEVQEQLSVFAAVTLLPTMASEIEPEDAKHELLEEALLAADLLDGLAPVLSAILPTPAGSAVSLQASAAGQWLAMQQCYSRDVAADTMPSWTQCAQGCLVQVPQLRIALMFPSDTCKQEEHGLGYEPPDIGVLCLLMVSRERLVRQRAAAHAAQMLWSGNAPAAMCRAASLVVDGRWRLSAPLQADLLGDETDFSEFVTVVESAVAAVPSQGDLCIGHDALVCLTEALDSAAAAMLRLLRRDICGEFPGNGHGHCQAPGTQETPRHAEAASREVLWGVARLAAAASRVCPQALAGKHLLAELLRTAVEVAGCCPESESAGSQECQRRDIIASSLAALANVANWGPCGKHRSAFVSGTLQHVLSTGTEFTWQASLLHAQHTLAFARPFEEVLVDHGFRLADRLVCPGDAAISLAEGTNKSADPHGPNTAPSKSLEPLQCYVARTRRLMQLRVAATDG